MSRQTPTAYFRYRTYYAAVFAVFFLTACKIDLTILGNGNVTTESNTFNCATETHDDCTQSYVTDVTQCPGYVAPAEGLLPTITPNCTVIVSSATVCSGYANATELNCVVDNGVQETFHAQTDQGSHFGSWTSDGFGCNGQSTIICNLWIDADSAGTNAQINITANFEQEAEPQSATYTYDHQGHRASKTYNGVTTYFNYSDIDGQLMGEYQYSGIGAARKLLPVREYIYLEGQLAAMNVWDNTVTPATKQIIYLATNQVGQPMVAWDSSGNPVYERQQTPFMESMGEYSAAGIEINMRSIGVYDDRESSYLQNWNRTIDKDLGFLSSDPTGQNGGINTYAYVEGNPVMNLDPMELYVPKFPWTPEDTSKRDCLIKKYKDESTARGERNKDLADLNKRNAEDYLYARRIVSDYGGGVVGSAAAVVGTVIHTVRKIVLLPDFMPIAVSPLTPDGVKVQIEGALGIPATSASDDCECK